MAVVESQAGGNVLAVPPLATPAATTAQRSGWLFNPLIDFLCLGGGSMLVLAALMLVPSSMALQADFAFWALLVAHAINHPHFAHSYQIFYSGFRRKAFGDTFEPGLRLRYVIAGIYVPILLTGYIVTTLVMGSVAALAYGANAMFFLVGWHYVKQGYGMAMLDAVLKKRFFKPWEKKVLLWNGYSGWLVSWLYVNQIVAKFDYWGLAYYSFATPEWMMDASYAAAAATTLALVAMVLLKAVKERGRLPWNGLIGYVVSLYGWLILARINPLFTLFVPAFHSLQYLVVVWRYQLNRTRAAPDAASRPAGLLPNVGLLRNLLFLVLGVFIGYLGFWGLPQWLNGHVPYDRAIFGPSVFLFVFWIFINIHHYFLDNVMWRRENPETRRYLFGAK